MVERERRLVPVRPRRGGQAVGQKAWARWYVYQALVFEACRQAVIKTHKHVKSSEGGAEAAKGRKTAADSEWRTDARKVAQAYVDEAAKAGRKPPTRADVIREIRRRCKATALPRTDRAIGNLIDDMRREGKIKLEQ